MYWSAPLVPWLPGNLELDKALVLSIYSSSSYFLFMPDYGRHAASEYLVHLNESSEHSQPEAKVPNFRKMEICLNIREALAKSLNAGYHLAPSRLELCSLVSLVALFYRKSTWRQLRVS